MRTRIHIDDLRVSCVIGCYPKERERTQEISVSIELDVDAREAAYEDSLSHTIDYMAIERVVRFILQAGRFRLLETAGHSLVRTLLGPSVEGPVPISANVSMTKFGVLSGQACPRVQMSGVARSESYQGQRRNWGSVDVLMENRRLGLYRLNVAPGQRVPPILLSRLRGQSLAEGMGLVAWDQDGPTDVLEPGATAAWDPDTPVSWRNLGDECSSLLCLTRPALDDIRFLELPQVVD